MIRAITLIATSRFELGVGGAIDLAHSALTEFGADAIVGDGIRHWVGMVM